MTKGIKPTDDFSDTEEQEIATFAVGENKILQMHVSISRAQSEGDVKIKTTLEKDGEFQKELSFSRPSNEIFDTLIKRNDNGNLRLTRAGIKELKTNRDLMIHRPDQWSKTTNPTQLDADTITHE